jgi:site-specific recombinase XerD
MSVPSQRSLEQIFETQIDRLATTLMPGSLHAYRLVARGFLHYLGIRYPEVGELAALRRDPHILGWLRHLCEQDPPLSRGTRILYLVCFRRLLNDLVLSGDYSILEGLIVRDDFPPLDHYLPKPLSPEDDRLLQQHLRGNDDLRSNALLLLRATGMRIGELLHLPTDCLRDLGEDKWALHVPLGKLHTERLVPVDDDIRHIHARLLLLRQYSAAAARSSFLLPQLTGHQAAYYALRKALVKAARQAGCSVSPRPHQLRHTYATEMLRLGVSLTAVKELLGHKDIRMTMRYILIVQDDLQRQYRLARQNMASLHLIPQLNIGDSTADLTPGIPAITKSLVTIRHLVEMYRRELSDDQARRKLQRLGKRLAKIAEEVDRFGNAQE